MDAIRKYWFIMERPVGSRLWTFAAMACDPESANKKAINICQEHKTCTRIVTAHLPDRPDTGSRYAVLSEDDEMFVATEGGAA
jgi:hypothetical protein